LILREYPNSTVDIFEKCNLPYGLVRYGVAPDHQDVKKVTKEMKIVGSLPSVRFYGGIVGVTIIG